MIVFGILWQKRPPDHRNIFYGYRTRRSMRSIEAWNKAHNYFGKLWLISGILSLITAAAAIAVFFKSNYFLIIYTVAVFIQLCAAVVPIFFTENMLKRSFDSDGAAYSSDESDDFK